MLNSTEVNFITLMNIKMLTSVDILSFIHDKYYDVGPFLDLYLVCGICTCIHTCSYPV